MIQAIECGSKSPYIQRPVTYWIDEKCMCIVYPEDSPGQSTLEDLINSSLGIGSSENIVLLVLEHVRRVEFLLIVAWMDAWGLHQLMVTTSGQLRLSFLFDGNAWCC